MGGCAVVHELRQPIAEGVDFEDGVRAIAGREEHVDPELQTARKQRACPGTGRQNVLPAQLDQAFGRGLLERNLPALSSAHRADAHRAQQTPNGDAFRFGHS
jgi:hypothetical protein